MNPNVLMPEFEQSMAFTKVFAALQKSIPDEAELNNRTLAVNKKIESEHEMIPPDLVGQMAAFRKAVGEEMWTTIAANPSLPTLLKQWVHEQRIKLLNATAKGMGELILPEHMGDITGRDVLGFLLFSARMFAEG